MLTPLAMKKIRLALMVLAFCGAVIGAFVSKANTSLLPQVYAHTVVGCCVLRPSALQSGCSPTNNGAQCSVFVPAGPCVGPNQVVPAFDDSNCTTVLYRP
jgi:hypothetical protein